MGRESWATIWSAAERIREEGGGSAGRRRRGEGERGAREKKKADWGATWLVGRRRPCFPFSRPSPPSTPSPLATTELPVIGLVGSTITHRTAQPPNPVVFLRQTKAGNPSLFARQRNKTPSIEASSPGTRFDGKQGISPGKEGVALETVHNTGERSRAGQPLLRRA
ncbi:hypothetical protein Droror1_Dr00000139 [Drosera rotundifolia]